MVQYLQHDLYSVAPPVHPHTMIAGSAWMLLTRCLRVVRDARQTLEPHPSAGEAVIRRVDHKHTVWAEHMAQGRIHPTQSSQSFLAVVPKCGGKHADFLSQGPACVRGEVLANALPSSISTHTGSLRHRGRRPESQVPAKFLGSYTPQSLIASATQVACCIDISFKKSELSRRSKQWVVVTGTCGFRLPTLTVAAPTGRCSPASPPAALGSRLCIDAFFTPFAWRAPPGCETPGVWILKCGPWAFRMDSGRPTEASPIVSQTLTLSSTPCMAASKSSVAKVEQLCLQTVSHAR
jgi:hypothetical protein